MSTSLSATEPKPAPVRLVSVNKNPERASRIIGRVAAAVEQQYTIQHVANCSDIDQVEGTVSQARPDIVFCASTWTAEESARIVQIARAVVPEVKTYIVPRGLVDKSGEDAMVEHLAENLYSILSPA